MVSLKEYASHKPSNDGNKEKKIQIFKVAEPLFERFGFKKTTIEDICKETGISKRTFYELFKDKADVFGRMILFIAETKIDGWYRKYGETTSATDAINGLTEMYVDLIQNHPVYALFVSDPSLFNVFGAMGQELQFSPLVRLMTKVISHGVETGEFRQLDPDTATWLIFSIMDSMYIMMPAMFDTPGALQDSHIAKEVNSFIINGLGGGKTK